MSDHDEGAFGREPGIGHNNPPIEREVFTKAKVTLKAAGDLKANISVIKSEAQADMIADAIRDIQKARHDLSRDRETRVGPINRRVTAINDEYRPYTNTSKQGTLDAVESQLAFLNRNWLLEKKRLQDEQARLAQIEADRLKQVAKDAQEKATRELERAKDGDVTDGPLDPVGAHLTASQATLSAHIAEAAANKLAKTVVRSGGGAGSNAVGLHKHIVRSIANKADLIKAVRSIGLHKTLVEAVISCAGMRERETGELTPGITRTEELR